MPEFLIRFLRRIFPVIAPAFLLAWGVASPAAAQTAGIMERTFFYNDIYHFVGHPYKSPAFGEIKTITQPFTAQCSGLNRIVVPFYVSGARRGHLKFNLYRSGRGKTLLVSQDIDLEKLPPPAPIGTHAVQGVLHHFWFSPQADSKNESYQWEIVENSEREALGAGIYLTRTPNPQLQPILVDGIAQPGRYAAFYSYCRYLFGWDEIFGITAKRLWREKFFIGFYLVLIGGLGGGVMRMREEGRR